VIFLNNSTYDIGKFRIIGSTLWEPVCSPNSNDSHKIYVDDGTLLNTKYVSKMFNTNCSFIEKEISNAISKGFQAVIMTHHSPPVKFMNGFPEKFIGNLPFWLYGHTHYSSHSTVRETLFLSNQVGYLQLGDKDKHFYPEVVVMANSLGEGKVVIESNEYSQKQQLQQNTSKSPPPPPPPPPPF